MDSASIGRRSRAKPASKASACSSGDLNTFFAGTRDFAVSKETSSTYPGGNEATSEHCVRLALPGPSHLTASLIRAIFSSVSRTTPPTPHFESSPGVMLEREGD